MKKKEELVVKNFYGKKLNIKNTKDAKIERINNYLLEGFIFSFVLSLIDVIAYFGFKQQIYVFNITNDQRLNVYIYILIEFIVLYCISFIIDYVYYEVKIEKSK